MIFVLPYSGLLRLRIAADASCCPLGFERSPSPSAHRKQVHLVNGIITVTNWQAMADTKALMEFYNMNAIRDMEWHRRCAGIADFA